MNVTFGERLVGIMQVLHLRMLEMEAALEIVKAHQEDPCTEALRVYQLARGAELMASIAALERKLVKLGEFARDPDKTMAPADIIDLDDYR